MKIEWQTACRCCYEEVPSDKDRMWWCEEYWLCRTCYKADLGDLPPYRSIEDVPVRDIDDVPTHKEENK